MQKSQTPSDNIKQACKEVEEAFELFINQSDEENPAAKQVTQTKNSPTMNEIKKTLATIKDQIEELSD